jgi:hypothetical protein
MIYVVNSDDMEAMTSFRCPKNRDGQYATRCRPTPKTQY